MSACGAEDGGDKRSGGSGCGDPAKIPELTRQAVFGKRGRELLFSEEGGGTGRDKADEEHDNPNAPAKAGAFRPDGEGKPDGNADPGD